MFLFFMFFSHSKTGNINKKQKTSESLTHMRIKNSKASSVLVIKENIKKNRNKGEKLSIRLR